MDQSDAQGIQISRVLHAGYIFSAAGTEIIFDPIFENPFSQNCYPFPAVNFDVSAIQKLKFSAVFISHYHDDHCSFDSLNLMDRTTPIYIYCIHQELIGLIKDLGFLQVVSLALDSAIIIGPFEITARKALDSDVDSIFQIQSGNLNILNVVDSWIDDETMQQLISKKPWDLILWPFQTMREIEVLSPLRAEKEVQIPKEWVEQLQQLNPKYLIASSCQFTHESWSWYKHAFFPISYRNFEDVISRSLKSTHVFKLNPGTSIVLTKNEIASCSRVPWITPVGPQEVDYEYQPEIKPPSTQEIAKHFPALLNSQTEAILKFCNIEMLERFRSLEWPESKFFLKKKKWKLSIYDHMGQRTSFTYEINKNRIEILAAGGQDFSWLTEVPAWKLFAVLNNGESLSSMYLRINDNNYSEEIELEIKDVDILEDPLIRVLFTGNQHFAAYQKAQLKRIKIQSL